MSTEVSTATSTTLASAGSASNAPTAEEEALQPNNTLTEAAELATTSYFMHSIIAEKKNIHKNSATCVALSDTLLLVGGVGVASCISVWKHNEGDFSFVGDFTYLVGSPTQLRINATGTVALACTIPGYIYAWSLTTECLELLEKQTAEQQRYGYILTANRVQPTAAFTPQVSRECVAVEFLQDDRCFIGIGKLPDLAIRIYCIQSNAVIAQISNLSFELVGRSNTPKGTMRKMFEFNCISVDTQRYSMQNSPSDALMGNWIAVGDSGGCCGIVFLSDKQLEASIARQTQQHPPVDTEPPQQEVEELDVYTAGLQLCNGTIEINSIVWIPRQQSTHKLQIMCGCSDGFVRCAYVKRGSSMELLLVASYMQRMTRGNYLGEVRRLCVVKGKDENAMIVGCCNMTRKSDFRVRDKETSTASTQDDADCIFEVRGRRINGKEMYCVLNQHTDQIIDLTKSYNEEYIASISIDKCVCIYKYFPSK